jgi:hypothetical protein
MILRVPDILFTEWVPWDERATLATRLPRPGVYAWAHFHNAPSRQDRPYPDVPPELIYVGETKNLNLRPLAARPPHHRLKHYGEMYPVDKRERQKLFVSVFRVPPDLFGDPALRLVRAFTRFLEDQIYWEYARRHGRRAALDYAAKSGHTSEPCRCCCPE